jgi:hypothetical protein
MQGTRLLFSGEVCMHHAGHKRVSMGRLMQCFLLKQSSLNVPQQIHKKMLSTSSPQIETANAKRAKLNDTCNQGLLRFDIRTGKRVSHHIGTFNCALLTCASSRYQHDLSRAPVPPSQEADRVCSASAQRHFSCCGLRSLQVCCKKLIFRCNVSDGNAFVCLFANSAYEVIVPARGKALIKTDLAIAVPEDCYGRIGIGLARRSVYARS